MTDCFVVSQLFRVTRHVGRFQLGSKPVQLYVRLNILPLSPQTKYVNSRIMSHYVEAFVCLHFALPDNRVLSSLRAWQPLISSPESSTLQGRGKHR